MSDFLCGEIVFGDEIEPDDTDIWFDLAAAAVANRLNIQFGANIIQKEVFEILGGFSDDNRMPFLITESPVSDVSDGLIDPDPYVHGGDGARVITRAALAKVAVLIRTCLGHDKVRAVEVVFSEGVDSAYETVPATPDTFVDVCRAHFARAGRVPSLRVVVS